MQTQDSPAFAATPGSRRMTVEKLKAHGFTQGSKEEQNQGECATCGRKITEARSWWIGGGGEYDDNWEGYCRQHAEERALADQQSWSDEAAYWEAEAAKLSANAASETRRGRTLEPKDGQ